MVTETTQVFHTSPITNERLKVLRNGRWHPMYTPVNCDRPFSGVSLAESFADAYSLDHDVDVGLIPCADGGTSLDHWEVGGLLFDNAIYQCKLAQRTSTIVGVLWHQGEAECMEERYLLYTAKFQVIMDELRRQLGLEDVPFLLGGLGEFLPLSYGNDNYKYVNQALQKIASDNSLTGYVSSEGLGANPDNLHFNARSLREFGLRYYEVFKSFEDKNRVYEEKNVANASAVTMMEML